MVCKHKLVVLKNTVYSSRGVGCGPKQASSQQVEPRRW